MKNLIRRHIGISLCLVLALAAAVAQVAISLKGKAVGVAQHVAVIDGDTLEVNGKIIQLYGIDAPELGQICVHDHTPAHCGLSAAYELHKLLSMEHAELQCRPAKAATDPSLQICTFAHTDLARVLLEGGYALTATDTSPEYVEVQDLARQGGLGLWHSQYVHPAEWRAGRRLNIESELPLGPCPIKAVVEPDKRRLYFVPTDPHYDAIKIDRANGDRRYCSDEAARKDGWRREAETD